MRKQLRDIVNHQNSLRSTGPKSPEGKKRSALNAFRHGLSGNHLIMQQHEFAAYESLCQKMLADLKPATEPEKQIAQKIIDLNFRINRITAIENNMLNFDMNSQEPDWEDDEGIARMIGQARAWKKEAQSFEILGRYESRLSKQLLQYQHELAGMKAERARATSAEACQTTETVPLKPESASFGKPAPSYINHAATILPETLQPTPSTTSESQPEEVLAA